MPNPIQKDGLSEAINAIRSAEVLLTGQIRNATDTLLAIKLTHEYNNLDSFLSGLLHLQNVTDDDTFAGQISAFKATAATLKIDQDAIRKIVADVQLAANIVSYIGKAIAVVAKM